MAKRSKVNRLIETRVVFECNDWTSATVAILGLIETRVVFEY